MTSGPVRLGEFIRSHEEAIVARFVAEVRRTAGRELPERELREVLPPLVRDLAAIVEPGGDENGMHRQHCVEHAMLRLACGHSLSQLLLEYCGLRRLVLELWRAEVGSEVHGEELERLDAAIDHSIAQAASGYAAARESMLNALDRIARVGVEGERLDQALERLVRVFQQHVADAHTVAVLVHDDGWLKLFAAVGLDQDLEARLRLRVGEGFAGAVAERGEPVFIADMAQGPLPLSPGLRASGVRVLYGVPLLHRGELMGVAHMGSRTLRRFSEMHRRLFAAMADRACGLMVQARTLERERQAREQAERNLAYLDAVLAGAPVAIALLDQRMRFVRVNDEMARLNGVPIEEHIGRTVDEVLGARADRFTVALSRVLETGQAEARREVALEERGHFLFSFYPVRLADGRVVGLASMAVDVTEMKRREKLQERIIGIVGHDLRNPLAAIRMAAHLLVTDPSLTVQSRRTAERIASIGGRMQRLISDLLDYTAASAGGGLSVHPVPADLREVVDAAVEDARAAFPDRQIRVARAGDTTGEWDRDRLEQVVSNLLSNAVKHGDPHGPIDVSVRGAEREVLLSVHNLGKPIPPAMLPTLFDPFRRREGAPGGLGLGLYIVREVVRAHRGTVEVQSGDEGTTFTVRLPRVHPGG